MTQPPEYYERPIEGEVVESSSARDLDAKLRSEVRTFVTSLDRIYNLIAEAKTRRIHEELGFKSWTAYIVDVITGELRWFNVDTRRQVVRLLAGEGMSQRAIAEAVGVSNATISRDEQVLHDVTPSAATTPAVVTGLDGKTYPPKPPKPPPKPDVPKPPPVEAEAEVVEEEYEPIDPETLAKFVEIEKRIDEAEERAYAAAAPMRALALDEVQLYAAKLARSLRNLIDVMVDKTSPEEAVRIAREQANILDDLDEAMEEFYAWQRDPLAARDDDDEDE